MADALRANDSQAFARAAAANPNFRSLTQNALDYAVSGITSLAEVLRISSDDEEFSYQFAQQDTGES
jgi:MSHA biogenesis protein MshE